MPVLVAEGVCKRYEDQTVLDAVDLKLHAGRLCLVAGRSGSGKSTLFSVLSGVEPPSSGRVLFRGRDLAGMGERERADHRLLHMGLVFQDFRLLPDLDVQENVRLPMDLSRRRGAGGGAGVTRSRRDAARRCLRLLADLDLDAFADRFPDSLSGGEQQRVAVARALANDPAVVLADEPTANLDEASAHAVMGMLRDAADAGRVVLVAAHDPLVRAYADDAYRLHEGGLLPVESTRTAKPVA